MCKIIQQNKNVNKGISVRAGDIVSFTQATFIHKVPPENSYCYACSIMQISFGAYYKHFEISKQVHKLVSIQNHIMVCKCPGWNAVFEMVKGKAFA